MDTFTFIACAIVLFAFLWAYIYMLQVSDDNLKKNRRWIDQLPTFVSTLGVIGTFAGIAKGLIFFDPDPKQIDNSIAILLEGLKTAFFTSLIGMAGSLILNRRINHKFDLLTSGQSETEEAATKIASAISSLESTTADNGDVIEQAISQFKSDFAVEAASLKQTVREQSSRSTTQGIRIDVEQVKDDLEELKGITEELNQLINSIKDNQEVEISEINRLRAVTATAAASIARIDNNAACAQNSLKKVESAAEEIQESIGVIQENQ